MKITICGSLKFTHEIKKIAEELQKKGHEVRIPLTSERILAGETTVENIENEKVNGEFSKRIHKYDSIRAYHSIIIESDAVLIANFDKNGVENYIGGATFLEMGFAHVNNKKIFLYKGVPKMGYTEEILGMKPIVLNKEIEKIK